MLEVLADVDHVLLGVVVGAEHADQGLLCLVQSALLNTESRVDFKSEKGDFVRLAEVRNNFPPNGDPLKMAFSSMALNCPNGVSSICFWSNQSETYLFTL